MTESNTIAISGSCDSITGSNSFEPSRSDGSSASENDISTVTRWDGCSVAESSISSVTMNAYSSATRNTSSSVTGFGTSALTGCASSSVNGSDAYRLTNNVPCRLTGNTGFNDVENAISSETGITRIRSPGNDSSLLNEKASLGETGSSRVYGTMSRDIILTGSCNTSESGSFVFGENGSESTCVTGRTTSRMTESDSSSMTRSAKTSRTECASSCEVTALGSGVTSVAEYEGARASGRWASSSQGGQQNKARTCTICQRVLSRTSHLYRHMRNVHGAGKKYLCPVCGKHFVNGSNVRRHTARFHGDEAARVLPAGSDDVSMLDEPRPEGRVLHGSVALREACRTKSCEERMNRVHLKVSTVKETSRYNRPTYLDDPRQDQKADKSCHSGSTLASGILSDLPQDTSGQQEETKNRLHQEERCETQSVSKRRRLSVERGTSCQERPKTSPRSCFVARPEARPPASFHECRRKSRGRFCSSRHSPRARDDRLRRGHEELFGARRSPKRAHEPLTAAFQRRTEKSRRRETVTSARCSAREDTCSEMARCYRVVMEYERKRRRHRHFSRDSTRRELMVTESSSGSEDSHTQAYGVRKHRHKYCSQGIIISPERCRMKHCTNLQYVSGSIYANTKRDSFRKRTRKESADRGKNIFEPRTCQLHWKQSKPVEWVQTPGRIERARLPKEADIDGQFKKSPHENKRVFCTKKIEKAPSNNRKGEERYPSTDDAYFSGEKVSDTEDVRRRRRASIWETRAHSIAPRNSTSLPSRAEKTVAIAEELSTSSLSSCAFTDIVRNERVPLKETLPMQSGRQNAASLEKDRNCGLPGDARSEFAGVHGITDCQARTTTPTYMDGVHSGSTEILEASPTIVSNEEAVKTRSDKKFHPGRNGRDPPRIGVLETCAEADSSAPFTHVTLGEEFSGMAAGRASFQRSAVESLDNYEDQGHCDDKRLKAAPTLLQLLLQDTPMDPDIRKPPRQRHCHEERNRSARAAPKGNAQRLCCVSRSHQCLDGHNPCIPLGKNERDDCTGMNRICHQLEVHDGQTINGDLMTCIENTRICLEGQTKCSCASCHKPFPLTGLQGKTCRCQLTEVTRILPQCVDISGQCDKISKSEVGTVCPDHTCMQPSYHPRLAKPSRCHKANTTSHQLEVPLTPPHSRMHGTANDTALYDKPPESNDLGESPHATTNITFLKLSRLVDMEATAHNQPNGSPCDRGVIIKTGGLISSPGSSGTACIELGETKTHRSSCSTSTLDLPHGAIPQRAAVPGSKTIACKHASIRSSSHDCDTCLSKPGVGFSKESLSLEGRAPTVSPGEHAGPDQDPGRPPSPDFPLKEDMPEWIDLYQAAAYCDEILAEWVLQKGRHPDTGNLYET